MNGLSAFPTWLAPIQVRVLTVSDRFNEYAEKLVATLRGQFVRAELDHSNERINKKIRNAVTHKIPNLLIVGEREEEQGTVTLRRYGVREQETVPFAEFEARVLSAIAARSLEFPAGS